MMMSNKKLYSFKITLIFQFNYTLNRMELFSSNYSFYIIKTFTQEMTRLIQDYKKLFNSEMIIQSKDHKDAYVWNYTDGAIYKVSGMPSDEIFSFFNVGELYYILQSRGLYEFYYNMTTRVLELIKKVS